MKLLDSRRLTGPNLLLDRPGAVIEVSLEPGEAEIAIAAWREQARRMLDAVGWSGEETAARLYAGGASLAISAPLDALYAATEVNEWAWAAAEASFTGREPEIAVGREVLREAIAQESNPPLLALRDAAAAHDVAFLADGRLATVGLGAGSLTWPVDQLPDPESIDWSAVHDVPVLLVTGTNGKTTTVRLTAAMASAAGKVAGLTSTDRIEVGGEEIEHGDFAGPEGARVALRDRRVEVAVLETARGGILRRGLVLDRADAALVTNIAADHLGDFGIHDLPALAAAKLVITSVVKANGRVVLNADDAVLVAAAQQMKTPIVWFSLEPGNPVVAAHLAAGGEAVYLEHDELVLNRGGERTAVIRIAEIPIAFGGVARHNIANASAAIGLAAALGLSVEAMAAGLRQMGSTPEDNPGRANLFKWYGVRILVDYAHNPHGIAALLDIAQALPAKRRLLVLGQAGDRSDEAIRDLARAAWELRPDHVIVKELPEMLRGRLAGEVPVLLEGELRRLGMPAGELERTDTELEAVRRALAWAQPGDLLVLLVHTQRDEVVELIRQARP
ncbi:MAG TPA: Mur ligase family protein [Thermoanaerobaculia bacterium]|jgi:cyanophycin synthetase|nr:Mur ligase family protein [Thermoanaerobaculia bacterium]